MSTTTLARGTPQRQSPSRDSTDLSASAVELRLLCTHEGWLVRRLAALDDAPALEGQVLVALIGGQAVAALSLRDQRVVANPFIPTSGAVALLRLRAQQVSDEPRRARRFRGACRFRRGRRPG
jgi:hypothetical protein